MQQQRQPSIFDSSNQMSIDQLQETALNVIYNFASIFTMPVEILIRPWFGSRYFSAPNLFFSAIFMTFASAFLTVATAAGQMIPFVRFRGAAGLYGFGAMTELFFLAAMFHGIRIWRRMIDMSREANSVFEGPPLPIFGWLPNSHAFYLVRIVYEPLFVYITATVLGTLSIIQLPLVLYLQVTSLFLAMKNYIAWYKLWAYVRNLMDMANAAPTIARFVTNSASDDELARVHLASLPKNLPPDIHKAAASYVARAYSVPEGGSHA
jgi:hypothetical protein